MCKGHAGSRSKGQEAKSTPHCKTRQRGSGDAGMPCSGYSYKYTLRSRQVSEQGTPNKVGDVREEGRTRASQPQGQDVDSSVLGLGDVHG